MMTMYVSPYRRLATLREAMDRTLEESLREKSTEREMLLAVDVRDENDGFTINAFVPGLDAEDLEIEILNNTVAIRGEFKSNVEGEARYMTCELPSGRFSRVISFPLDVDASKAEANIKNGFLTLRVPKAEAVRPKSIKVNVN
jgi:HSP20 family protein